MSLSYQNHLRISSNQIIHPLEGNLHVLPVPLANTARAPPVSPVLLEHIKHQHLEPLPVLLVLLVLLALPIRLVRVPLLRIGCVQRVLCVPLALTGPLYVQQPLTQGVPPVSLEPRTVPQQMPHPVLPVRPVLLAPMHLLPARLQ